MPRSKIFSSPLAETITLVGFRSRCTTPSACRAASPRASCLAHSRAVSGGMGTPLSRRVRSVWPSTSSVTKNGRPDGNTP